MRRGATPDEDRSIGFIDEGVITEVTPYEDGGGWSVSYGEHMGCGVRDVGTEPKVGDLLTVFGPFGSPFHGQALNGKVLWYLTPEEQGREHAAAVERDKQGKRDKFEQDRAKLDADYDGLPDVFRRRIDKFRATRTDWRWEYESYEMSCCVDAVKIAAYCTVNGREATSFRDFDAGLSRAAGLYDGHSGNSYGWAVRLAHWYLTDPEMVVKDHGALTPLVGCIDYGCPHDQSPSMIAEDRRSDAREAMADVVEQAAAMDGGDAL